MNGEADHLDQTPAEAIFDAGLELAPAERSAWLAGACGNNPPLRQRVEALLRAHDEAQGFLPAQPAVALAQRETKLVPVLEKPGDKIGRYTLREKIGEGGCGVVYVAEQEQPVRRRVALKVIKLGMDTRSVVARFEAERQALAMMDHSNIAKVHDAGATDTGRPYFVMELVRGIKITDYCDQNSLSTRARLDLFIKVCQAVQHAHQKGIIHRDLKPSNILVTLHDGVPVPKVIDFGIAKATEGRLTDATVYTELHQFMGTPAYMSPEQAEMTGLDVDTRSDIYSLGVLLYELLTGKTPFDARELWDSGMDAMRRTIREKEPVRPSTRLQTMLAGELTTTARQRQAEPPKLINLLRGDLDWVVMKALEKDRTRRYDTANGFAQDIHRHLNDEAVVARPPSLLYKFHKTVRRNKTAFAAAAAVLAALVTGFGLTAWQAVRATRAERHQTHLRAEAERSRSQAQAAQASEARERAVAEQRLYASLVGEAHAIRMARRVGYRERVFALLQQARAMEVPNKNLADLRRAAGACLGDFVGLQPMAIAANPTNALFSLTAVDATGQVAAFAMSDGSIVIRNLPSGEEAGRLKGDRAIKIKSLSFSSTGDGLVSLHTPASSSGESLSRSVVITCTRGPDGRWREEERMPVPGAFQCLGYPRGHLLAVLDRDSGIVEILDLKDRHLVLRLDPPAIEIWRPEIAVSADGRFLAVQSVERLEPNRMTVELWNLESRTLAQRWQPRTGEFGSITFSPDGVRLGCLSQSGGIIYATDGSPRFVELKDYFSQELRFSFLSGHPVVALPLSQQNRVRLWDCLRNQDFAILDEPFPPYAAVFSQDGRFLLTSGREYARLYPLNMSAEKLGLSGHSGGVPAVAFGPNGTRLASVGKDQTLKVWDAVTARVIWESAALPGPGQCVAYSPDGRRLVTSDYLTRRFALWDAATGERLGEFGTNAPLTMWSARFSPDGKYLATASDRSRTNGEVQIWAIAETSSPEDQPQPIVSLLRSHEGPPSWGLVFAPVGQQVAFTDRFASVSALYVWNFGGDDPPRSIKRPLMVGVHCVAYLPDGRHVLVVGPERQVLTVDTLTGTTVSSFPTVSPDPSAEATAGATLCVSPDGSKLALASASRRRVDFWDPRTGTLHFALPDEHGAVWGMAWSPDSRRLAVSRSTGDIAIWNLGEVERVLARLGLNP